MVALHAMRTGHVPPLIGVRCHTCVPSVRHNWEESCCTVPDGDVGRVPCAQTHVTLSATTRAV